jgi:hypothetical protein
VLIYTKAAPAMNDDTTLPFAFAAVCTKKISAAFDRGRLSSDGGVMLLALGAEERKLAIADKLAAAIADRRDPARTIHTLANILRARILAIACGYEDADDLSFVYRSGVQGCLCRTAERTCARSRPCRAGRTCRRCRRSSGLVLGQVMIDLYCASYATPPAAVTLDIDDTLDVVHGHQQLSLFKAHYDERCFLPIHVYDTATGRPVAVILPLQPMTSAPAARSRKRQSCALGRNKI